MNHCIRNKGLHSNEERIDVQNGSAPLSVTGIHNIELYIVHASSAFNFIWLMFNSLKQKRKTLENMHVEIVGKK